MGLIFNPKVLVLFIAIFSWGLTVLSKSGHLDCSAEKLNIFEMQPLQGHVNVHSVAIQSKQQTNKQRQSMKQTNSTFPLLQ